MFTIITTNVLPGCRVPFFSRGGKLAYRTAGNASFAVLQVRRPEKLNWRRIQKRLGNSAGRVLCGQGIALPPEGMIASVDIRRYSHILAQNGLTELLKPNRPLTCERSATLVDLNCRHQAFADILVRFFKDVRIVTRNCELYQNYVDSKFYECGAAILIADSLDREWGASLYVSPDGVLFPSMEAGIAPVIMTAEPETPVRAPVISGFRARTPAELDIAPEDVDPHAFQAALFGCCGVGKLAALLPDRASLNGSVCSIGELAAALFLRERQPA